MSARLGLLSALLLLVPASAPSAGLLTRRPVSGNTGPAFFVFLPIANSGTADLSSLQLVSVALTYAGSPAAALQQPATLPYQTGAGFLAAGGSRMLDLEFANATLVDGVTYLLHVNGTYMSGGRRLGFALNRPVQYKAGLVATHTQVTNLIALKGSTLPVTDKATQNQLMLQFVSGLPLVEQAGIGSTSSLVWVLFFDTGRKYVFLNNDTLDPAQSPPLPPPAPTSAARPLVRALAPVPVGGATAGATDLPQSRYARLLNGMGTGVTNVVPQLQTWLIGEGGYLSSGGDMSVASLRTVGGDGVLYIGSHGGVDDGSDTPFNFWTTTPDDGCDEILKKSGGNATCPDAEIQDDLEAERIGVFGAYNKLNPATGEYDIVENHYGIYATRFAQAHWGTFGANAFVYMDTCDSDVSTTSVQEFKRELSSLGASAYAGWSESQRTPDGAAVTQFVFDRLLGANAYCPENGTSCAPGPAVPPAFAQRAFDYGQALTDLGLHGLGSSLGASFGIESLGGSFGLLAPTIGHMFVDETQGSAGQLYITGIFGSDPRPDGEVRVGGQSVGIQSWSANQIVANLTANGAGSSGDVQVVVRSHPSNVARLTDWRSDQYRETISGNGSLQLAETFNLHFRADIRKYREQIHQDPIEPNATTAAAADSRANFSASGAGTANDETYKWSNFGPLDNTIPTPAFTNPIFVASLAFTDSTHAKAQIAVANGLTEGAQPTCTEIDSNGNQSFHGPMLASGPSDYFIFMGQTGLLSFNYEVDKDTAQIAQGVDQATGTAYDCMDSGLSSRQIFSWGPVPATGGTEPDPNSAR